MPETQDNHNSKDGAMARVDPVSAQVENQLNCFP